jgi:PTH1 family peptidyl-tRNA hydrolase
MWLVVGLGNPGPKYAQHRHNIGFMVEIELSRRWQVEGTRVKFGAELTQATYEGEKVVLVKPQEFMNVSGRAVQRAASFYQVEPKHIVVIHDEIDFELGRLAIKAGGGHGGHNGLRSIIADLGCPDFVRIRCGVGRPGGSQGNVVGHVLGDFQKGEKTEVAILVKEAADAVQDVIKRGPLRAMNKVNVREKE